MALSDLLQQACFQSRPVKTTALPADYPGGLSFSVSDGRSGRMSSRSGDQFDQPACWPEPAGVAQNKTTNHSGCVLLSIALKNSAGKIYRRNSASPNAIISALAFLSMRNLLRRCSNRKLRRMPYYDGDNGVAAPNGINLENYGQRRFKQSLSWPDATADTLAFQNPPRYSATAAAPELIEHSGRSSGYRVTKNGKNWLAE